MLLNELYKKLGALIEEDRRNGECELLAAIEDDGLPHNLPPGGYVTHIVDDYVLSNKHQHNDHVFVICTGKPVMYSRPYWWSTED